MGLGANRELVAKLIWVSWHFSSWQQERQSKTKHLGTSAGRECPHLDPRAKAFPHPHASALEVSYMATISTSTGSESYLRMGTQTLNAANCRSAKATQLELSRT